MRSDGSGLSVWIGAIVGENDGMIVARISVGFTSAADTFTAAEEAISPAVRAQASMREYFFLLGFILLPPFYFINIFFSSRKSAESVFPSPLTSDAAFCFSVPIIILARVTMSATVTASSPLTSPRIF